MPAFTYVARTRDGSLTEGSIEASDRAAAVRQIEALRQVPIKIVPAAEKPAAARGAKSSPSAPTAADGSLPAADASLSLPLAQLFLFTEQLAHLLSAGMTLDEALSILVKRLQQPRLQTLCRALHQGLIDGRSLSQTMRDFPKIFDPLYVNMVSAGEASGALPQILRRLVTHLSGVKALRDSVKAALWYPAALVVAGIALVIVFMTVMVPQLTSFFANTGQRLPLPTRILLAGNHAITHYWWVAGLAVGGAVSGWKYLVRTPEGMVDAFDISVGGTLGLEPQLNKPLKGRVKGDDVPRVLEHLLKFYKENKSDEETFHQFVNRVGVEAFQEKLNEVLAS